LEVRQLYYGVLRWVSLVPNINQGTLLGKLNLALPIDGGEYSSMPRKLGPRKEGKRGGRPRTNRTQITVRVDPDVLARLTLAGLLYRFVEVIAPGNYEGLNRATPVPGKVIEVLVREHIDQWMSKTLERLINSGMPEEVSERLRREFPKHWPDPERGNSHDTLHYQE
jgi:hypothetical protein